jgi:hypothetical protein
VDRAKQVPHCCFGPLRNDIIVNCAAKHEANLANLIAGSFGSGR